MLKTNKIFIYIYLFNKQCSLPLIKEHASDSNSSTYIHSRKPASPCYITLRKLRPKDIFVSRTLQMSSTLLLLVHNEHSGAIKLFDFFA